MGLLRPAPKILVHLRKFRKRLPGSGQTTLTVKEAVYSFLNRDKQENNAGHDNKLVRWRTQEK